MSRRRAAKDHHSVVPQMESASPADSMGMYGNTVTAAMLPMGNMFASAHEGMNVSQMGHIGQVYGVYEGEAGVEAAAPAARSRQNRKAQVKAKQGQRKQQQASKRKLNESDEEGEGDSEDEEEMGTVPDGHTAADIAKNKYNHIEDEKERKRLKRLLRNRVSAQQARERKKAYMSTLESQFKETEQRVLALEQQVNKLERENNMLRQVVKSTTKNTDYGEM